MSQCQYRALCSTDKEYVFFSIKDVNASEIDSDINDLKYFSSLEDNESFDCTDIALISTSICTDNTCEYEIQ